MDDLFENLLPLIPIVIIFALRFLFWKRKQAGNQKRKNGASPWEAKAERAERRSGPDPVYREERRSGLNSLYEEGRAYEEDRVYDEEEGGSGGTFSAWDLPVNSEDPPPKPVSVPASVSAPVYLAPAFPSAEKEAKAPPPSAGKANPSGFPENLALLSPLQRAVVLAEILGPPKGM